MTFAGLLAEEHAEVLDDEGKGILERIQDAASRMYALVQDLLQLLRVASRSKPFRRLDVNRVGSEVLVDLEARADRPPPERRSVLCPRTIRDGVRVGRLPHQSCSWRDVLMGRQSLSLGAGVYKTVLTYKGLDLVGEFQDEGDNHYFDSRKP